MKKILIVICTLICAAACSFTYAACGSDEDDNKQQNNYDPNIVQDGYIINGGYAEPVTGYECAYELERYHSVDDEFITVQFSFGTNNEIIEGCTKVIAAMQTKDRSLYVLDEIAPEKFFTQDYSVHSIIQNDIDKNGNIIGILNEEIIFAYTGTYQFPISLCDEQSGSLMLVILVYAEDELIDNTGASQTLFYKKNDDVIQFQTYFEYYTEYYSTYN